MNSSAPIIFKNKKNLPRGTTLTDAFKTVLKELFFIRNPKYKKGRPETNKFLNDFLSEQKIRDNWIYYPWKKTAVRSLPEDLYFKLRTARNRDIINQGEQTNYRNIKIGIAGLSVGSAALSALVISGGPKIMKIADFDVVEVSNLNRIRATLLDVGINKTEIAARMVWELDPFAELYLWDKGLDKNNIEEFILGKPKLNIFIDEMDSLDLKVVGRLICKKNKIPVLMATDNGDGIILDVERFDLEPKRSIFHGLLENTSVEKYKNLDYKKWLELATKIVDPKYLTTRMQESLLSIGKTIASVPQLGTSATLAGSAVSFAVRKIASKEPLLSGRYIINLEEKLVPEYLSKGNILKREQKTKEFLEKFRK